MTSLRQNLYAAIKFFSQIAKNSSIIRKNQPINVTEHGHDTVFQELNRVR